MVMMTEKKQITTTTTAPPAAVAVVMDTNTTPLSDPNTTIILTEAEQAGKKFIFETLHKGFIQTDEKYTEELQRPLWYDDIKFKRGQKYFQHNRYGIMDSNLCGLLTLLAEPLSLRLLAATGKSSTPETARKRYVSTTIHMLDWYETELIPGSKSWVSLSKVRKMHGNASNFAKSKQLNVISQTELSLTMFGFMGLALVRPKNFGIRCDNDADREAFVHFWAVIGSMLGIRDEYNMCLLPLATIEIVCLIIIRYFFAPYLQQETVQFKQMVNAFFDGMSKFMPGLSYDFQMFKMKSVLGLPGYQYSNQCYQEPMGRHILTELEIQHIQEYLELRFGFDCTKEECWTKEQQQQQQKQQQQQHADILDVQRTCPKCSHVSNVLTNKAALIRRFIQNEYELDTLKGDFYFHQLKFEDRMKFKLRDLSIRFYGTSIGRWMMEATLDAINSSMKRFQRQQTWTTYLKEILTCK